MTTQKLTFTDKSDLFQALGKKEIWMLEGSATLIVREHPTELAAMVAVASQMFFDHEGRYEEESEESHKQTDKIRALFNQMREIAGCVQA